jgi:hypothetical protein
MTSAATGPDAPTTVLATHHLEEVPSTVTPRRAAHRGAWAIEDRSRRSFPRASRCYGLDIVVEWRDGRWWARAC